MTLADFASLCAAKMPLLGLDQLAAPRKLLLAEASAVQAEHAQWLQARAFPPV